LAVKTTSENNSSEGQLEDIKSQENVINESVNLEAGLEDVESFILPDETDDDNELESQINPPQNDEFICTNCFLVKHISQLSPKPKLKNVCLDCA
jgi:hypothetical protein